MRRLVSLLLLLTLGLTGCREGASTSNDNQTGEGISVSSRYDLLITALNDNGWAKVDKTKVGEGASVAVRTEVKDYTVVIDLVTSEPVSYAILSVNGCSRPFNGEAIALQNPDLTLSELESILSRVSPSNFVGCPGDDSSSGSDL